MVFDRARTSLANVEEKLRNYFNLAGAIDTTFKADITPHFVVGDARDPGVASFRGRHWHYQFDGFIASGVNNVYGVQFPAAVIIRSVWVWGLQTTNDRVDLLYVSPDDAQLATWGGGNRVCGTWVDNKRQSSETTPFLDRAAAVAFVPASRITKLVNTWVGAGNAPILRVSWHIPAGGALWLYQGTALAAAQVTWGCSGEIF